MDTRHAVTVLVFWLSTAVLTPAYGQSDAWEIVLNGRAVHLHASQTWNENNWGLGVEREFNRSGRWVKVALANGFRDSADHPSYMAGGGVKRRFRAFSDRLYVDVGVVGFLMTRHDVNHDRPFPGMLPALTIGGKRVAVNLTYLPESAMNRMTNANGNDPSLNGILFIQVKLAAGLFRPAVRREWLASRTETQKQ
jgi:Antimicrobial peptide resistance and lipid A acylation protein PagP